MEGLPPARAFNVLVLCTHNAARSVMGEAMLNHLASAAGHPVRAYSAGSAPAGQVHPMALRVLDDAGVDTTGLASKSWDRFCGDGAPSLDLVITVCDSAAGEACPLFESSPGRRPVRAHWSYPDPSGAPGDGDARRRAFDLTRQALGYRMARLLALPLGDLTDGDLLRSVQDIARC